MRGYLDAMPTQEEAEDGVLDLPPSDGALTDDDGLADFDDGDDDASDDDSESIGLDVSVGFDQDADLADLIDHGDREDQRWTEGTEAASELIKIDARDLATDDNEYGWTDDNEDAGVAVAHRGDELDDGDLPALGADSDEEGFGDERGAGEGDEVDLPPIDAGEPDVQGAPDGIDSALLGRLDQLHEPEPDRVEAQPGVSWPWFPRPQVRVSEIGPSDSDELIHLRGAPFGIKHDILIKLDAHCPGAQRRTRRNRAQHGTRPMAYHR